MRDLIIKRLHEIEKNEQIRILLAVESGSRAWGFDSPDSDYDVRFIYVRNHSDYLKLEKVRDVIELPIKDLLDINGWDLAKTLRLLYSSNPTLFEWFSSPIVYYENEDFCKKFRKLLNEYFLSKKELYHYLSMAKGNYREFFQGDIVKAKKYFYVLRPILACKWIIEKNTAPPMSFRELLYEEMEPSLIPEVERILDIKVNSPETKMIPRIDCVNEYLENSLEELSKLVSSLPKHQNSKWEPLNRLFYETVTDIKLNE